MAERKFSLEVAVGAFMVVGILALGYISVKLGRLEVIGGKGYSVFAEFEKAGGIKPGATVEIAGVQIGKVKSIGPKDYQARIELQINEGVQIQEDAIASLKARTAVCSRPFRRTRWGSRLPR